MRYNSESFNKIINGIQNIRITDGCPNQCEFCYCPPEYIYHSVPPIKTETVKILDMNLLASPDFFEIIDILKAGNVKNIELVSGIDYRYLNEEKARLLKETGFKKIRFAWDGRLSLQYKMKDTWKLLLKAGYKSADISVFILCNWKIPPAENYRKLDLLKIWNLKACDCYFDGQVFPNVVGLYWRDKECWEFRRKCRKHNQMVLFGIDPELEPYQVIKEKNQECLF